MCCVFVLVPVVGVGCTNFERNLEIRTDCSCCRCVMFFLATCLVKRYREGVAVVVFLWDKNVWLCFCEFVVFLVR